jgi:hypothetical protein
MPKQFGTAGFGFGFDYLCKSQIFSSSSVSKKLFLELATAYPQKNQSGY